MRWDPKEGDLLVTRKKSEETLMEVRRIADVQIACQSCQ